MNLEYFFFDLPINTPLKITETERTNEFEPLFRWLSSHDIEGYNPIRKKQSTFSISKRFEFSNGKVQNDGYTEIQIQCRRYSDVLRFYCRWIPAEKVLIKYGQHPTVADFHVHEIKQYKKLLSQDKLREFTKAIGLAANGVGIGSFVYLRRVFEHLINEAYTEAQNDKKIDEELFKKSRMDEKIEILSDFLPVFLVSNKGIYSILSLGVHELDEKTCLENFDTLRVGIEIILDEKLEELRKRQKILDAQKKIDLLKSTLNK
ncbi:hypothetical protein KIM67_08775 [Flagellimonas sp. 389]|uniref:hypothetical protein n=1 Tax=Flagellimonas sp. 389 TaxID=2835862 RepID=UPI001BD333FB|nr:hypothetical protein [Flagellimonas sp. 389]MBS9462502.1 hypothetical protein [Flagellimonas sp. 389]